MAKRDLILSRQVRSDSKVGLDLSARSWSASSRRMPLGVFPGSTAPPAYIMIHTHTLIHINTHTHTQSAGSACKLIVSLERDNNDRESARARERERERESSFLFKETRRVSGWKEEGEEGK